MEIGNSSLNLNQQRRIQITLYLLDQSLEVIAGYLREPLPCGEMYVTVSDLQQEQRDELLKLVGEIKTRIAEIRNQFGLETKVDDVRAMIMGYLGNMWESLHNARPRNLHGFGPVAPELFTTLDPRILQIIELVNAMSKRISNK
jgi:hypothetical protein